MSPHFANMPRDPLPGETTPLNPRTLTHAGGTETEGVDPAPGRCPLTLCLHRPLHNAASKPLVLLAKPKGNFGVIIIIFSFFNLGSLGQSVPEGSETQRDGTTGPEAPPGRTGKSSPQGFWSYTPARHLIFICVLIQKQGLPAVLW